MRKRVLLRTASVCVALATGARLGECQPAPHVGAKVHVVYAADNEDLSIGAFIHKNIPMFEGLIETQIRPERRGSFTKLYRDDCTAERVKKTLAELPVAAADTVLVFYQGHGAYDDQGPPGDKSQGHYLQFPDAKLYRSELLSLVKQRSPRLSVLISDCCNVNGTVQVPQALVAETKVVSITGWTGVEDMLLSYRGVVDATAASRDQYSWFSNDVGGWFTYKFMGKCLSLTEAQPVDWKTTWKSLAEESEAFFQQQKVKFAGQHPKLEGQAHMMPVAYTLEVERAEAGDVPTESIDVMYPVWVSVPTGDGVPAPDEAGVPAPEEAGVPAPP